MAKRVGLLLALIGASVLVWMLTSESRARSRRSTSADHEVSANAARDQESTPAAAEPAVVHGRVRAYATGSFVSAAYTFRAGERPSTGRTDAHGTFRFEARTVGVAAELALHAAAFGESTVSVAPLRAGEVRDLGTLWVRAPGRAHILVVDPAGKPVANARVAIGIYGMVAGTPIHPRAQELRTGADGTADASMVGDASWRFFAWGSGFGASAMVTRGIAPGSFVQVLLTLGPPHRLVGRVVDASGAPSPGIEVLVAQDKFTYRDASRYRAVGVEAKTDRDGQYEVHGLRAGIATVYAGVPGGRFFGIATINIPEVPRLDFRYSAAATRGQAVVAGTVRSSVGQPMDGVNVSASIQTDWGYLFERAITDARGRYEITDLPAGLLTGVSARAFGYREREASFARTSLKGDVRVEHDLVMDPRPVLRGVVRDAEGPLPGAQIRVVVRSKLYGATTDGNGHYRLDRAPPGPAIVFASREGYFIPGAPLGRSKFQSVPKELQVKIPTEGEAVLDIVMRRGIPVRGRVTTPEGRPVSDLLLRYQPRHGRNDVHEPRAATDADGRFTIHLPPGDGWLHAVHERYAMDPHKVTVHRSDESKPLSLLVHRKRRVTIKGRVLDLSGPVSGASVRVQASGNLTRVWNTVTRDDGAYELSIEVALGRSWKATVQSPTHRVTTARRSVAADQLSVTLDFQLAPNPTVSGVVVRNGRPVAGARVRIDGGSLPVRVRGERVAAVTDDAGRFALAQRFLFNLNASASTEDARSETVRITAENANDLRLELLPTAPLGGTVRTSDGKPVRFLTITARRLVGMLGTEGRTLERIHTDEHGRFVVPNALPGTYGLDIDGGSGNPIVVSGRHECKTGSLSLALVVKNGAYIAGRVRSVPDSLRVRDVEVMVVDATSGKRVLHARLERDGRFRAGPVPIGVYDVLVTRELEFDGFAAIARRGSVRTGANDVEFVLRSDGDIRGTVVPLEKDDWPGNVIVVAVQMETGHLVPRGELAATAEVDDKGAFVLPAMPPGFYELRWVENYENRKVLARSPPVRPGATRVQLIEQR